MGLPQRNAGCQPAAPSVGQLLNHKTLSLLGPPTKLSAQDVNELMRSHERGDHINFVSEEFIGSRSTMLLQHRQHIPFSANGRSHKLCATPSSLVTASSTCSSSRVRQQQLRGCRPAARLAPQPCRAAASDMSLPDPQQRSTSPGDIVSDTGNVLDPQVCVLCCVLWTPSGSHVCSTRAAPTSCPPPHMQAVSSWLSQYLPFKIISPSSVDLLAEVGRGSSSSRRSTAAPAAAQTPPWLARHPATAAAAVAAAAAAVAALTVHKQPWQQPPRQSAQQSTAVCKWAPCVPLPHGFGLQQRLHQCMRV